MNSNDYLKIIKYFPPVNPHIENAYEEAKITYNYLNFPLKKLHDGLHYSIEIFNNLRTLRILLNSNIIPERFLYELNKLVSVWGPGGYYGENILKSTLLDSINTINIKEQKIIEIMEESKEVILQEELNDLEKGFMNVSFNKTNRKNSKIPSRKKKQDIDDYGFNKLNISDKSKHSGIYKKSIHK
jgi:hypothetical protein